jgi:hypothetical protein
MNEQLTAKIDNAIENPGTLSKKEIISLLAQSRKIITAHTMEILRLRAINNSLSKQKESSL